MKDQSVEIRTSIQKYPSIGFSDLAAARAWASNRTFRLVADE